MQATVGELAARRFRERLPDRNTAAHVLLLLDASEIRARWLGMSWLGQDRVSQIRLTLKDESWYCDSRAPMRSRRRTSAPRGAQ